MRHTNTPSETAPANRQRVVVGLSGGVDSAVAAALLQEQGYEVQGAFLHLWRAPDAGDSDALARAQAVAARLEIPLRIVERRERFYERVVQPFAEAYLAGRTPNPCVFCNPGLKFAALLDVAGEVSAAWIATGHYARVRHDEGGSHLLRARARRKDQAYALYRLTQRLLRHLRLPLGELTSKADVRALARSRGLPTADVGDSQDLCFMGGGDYRTLLGTLHPEAAQPGPIYNEAGELLGEHSGLPHYTVGQRSGLDIAAPERLYVLRLDPERNALVVGPNAHLLHTTCRLEDVTFIAGTPPAATFAAQGRPRYHAPLTPITVTMLAGARATVTFAEPQRGLAPGQSLVCYDGEEVLGGGVIAEVVTDEERSTQEQPAPDS